MNVDNSYNPAHKEKLSKIVESAIPDVKKMVLDYIIVISRTEDVNTQDCIHLFHNIAVNLFYNLMSDFHKTLLHYKSEKITMDEILEGWCKHLKVILEQDKKRGIDNEN